MSKIMKAPIALPLILLIGLVHGLIYLALLPPWQHYDEPNHFEYAWLVANWRRIPQPGEYDPGMRREVAQSMIENGFYEGLGYVPDVTVADGNIPIGTYSQLGDPPLYYVLAALPVGLLKHQPVEIQLYGARLMSVGLMLLSLVSIYGLIGELTIPGSPLRWLIPGWVALLPGYIELMSAVNSDVGAAAFMAVALWGSVCLVKRGWRLGPAAWSGLAVTACLFTKETAYLAAPVWGISVVLSWLPGKWKRLGWIALAALGLFSMALSIGWGDAALWYRATDQSADTRGVPGAAPLGEAVFTLQIEAPDQVDGRQTQLTQLILPDTMQAIRGQRVTIGAWMWADTPTTTLLPVLTAFKQDRSTDQTRQTVDLSTTPVFYAYLATVPENTTQLQIHLSSANLGSAVQGNIYIDGVVLAAGEHPVDQPPDWDSAAAVSGAWGGVRVANAVRNASAESSAPRVYPWVDQLGSRFIPDHGRPSLLLYSWMDFERTASYYRATAKNLLQTFWGKFAWGHVVLQGQGVYALLAGVTVIGLLGSCLGIGNKLSRNQGSAIGVLALAVAGVWGFTLVRGVFYIIYINGFIPSARYAYPVIGPSMGLLGYGYWCMMSLIGKSLKIKPVFLVGALAAGMLILDAWSVISIWRFYAG